MSLWGVKMPIYEYCCDQCSHDLEVLQKIAEEPLRFCPECGGESLKKQVSASGFRLKGTGWYETDFKGKKASSKNKAENNSGKAESSSEPKSSGTASAAGN